MSKLVSANVSCKIDQCSLCICIIAVSKRMGTIIEYLVIQGYELG